MIEPEHRDRDEPAPAEPDRHLVAEHARGGADEAERGQQRTPATGCHPSSAVLERDESEKRDAPAAQRIHLERVDAVRLRVGHRGAIAKDGSKIEQAAAVGRRGGIAALARRGQRHDRTTRAPALARSDDERRAPAVEAQQEGRRRRTRSRRRRRCSPRAPATARDMSFSSTLSARSFTPVMYVPAQPMPVSARVARAPTRTHRQDNPNMRWPATVQRDAEEIDRAWRRRGRSA